MDWQEAAKWDESRWESEFESLMEETRKHIRSNPDADQVIGIKTMKDNLYFVVSHNAMKADFREENAFFRTLLEKDDTEVLCFVTILNGKSVDMCSWNFRTKLLEINTQNLNAVTLLQGPGAYHAKPLKNLLPPEKTERKKTL